MTFYVVPTPTGWQAVREGHRRGETYTTAWSAARGAARKLCRHGGGEILYLNSAGKVRRRQEVW